MLGTILDSMVGVISPRWAVSRIAHRNILTRMRNTASGRHESMERMIGSRSAGGYEAGKTNRLTRKNLGSAHENDLPRDQINMMRWRAWNLFRNNPQARKIVRTLCAKIVGKALCPQPQATMQDGSAFVAFRQRARQVWEEFSKEADWRGKPGRGGQPLTMLMKTALKSIVLSGGVLYRFRNLTVQEQKRKGLLLPLQLQLVHVDRLDEQKHDGVSLFYGVDLDNDGRPSGYHILNGGVTKTTGQESSRVPAAEMGHLFMEDDIDQLLGSSWFSAALLTMDDRRQYEYSELTAAEMGACFVAGYRRSSGQSQFGLQNPDSEGSLTDADGNAVTRMQPGMFLDLGATGEIDLLNPNRPNSGAEAFLSYLMRSEAVSMPGVKSSTLTGDYRNSSFSSERSADNDAWPEIEELQDWFSGGFSQPVYEAVITAAVTQTTLFDDVEGFSVQDFQERKRDYLRTNWQGPVARSINPKDDANAAGIRVKRMQSTPQRECAKVGQDWREIILEFKEYIQACQDAGLPDDIWQQALGIEQKDAEGDVSPPSPTEHDQDAAAAAIRMRA